MPAALPTLLLGRRVVLALEWIAIIVGETVGANSGTGFLLTFARQFVRTDIMMVCVCLYAVLGLATDYLVRLLARWLLCWRVDGLWYLTGPDGRYPWRADGARALTYPYFQQLARAVDHLGFTGALLATGAHDAWVQGAALIPYTDNLQHLIAAHPPLLSPTLLAKMITTFDQFSKGRSWA